MEELLKQERVEAVIQNSLQRCSTCKKDSATVQFAKHQNVCNPCKREYHRKWYQKRKAGDDTAYLAHQAAKLRRSVFLRKLKHYNLTEEQYNAMAAKGCAICGGPPRGRGRYHFDHNPVTGQFRGLLCGKCNPALGLFNEDQTLLIRAAGYLAAHVE